MNRLLLTGIFVMLVLNAGLLSQVGYDEYLKKMDTLSISNLKIKKDEYLDKIKSPDSSGKVNRFKLESVENQFLNLNLAREDVSHFFDKSIPLDKQNMTLPYLLTWVSFAASDIMSFGFNDADLRFGLASDYFTEKGWSTYADAFNKSRILEMVQANQQVVTAAPSGAPVLVAGNVKDGIYQWVVEVPMVVSYQSGAKTQTQKILLTVLVNRSDDAKHPYGIAINQWIAVAR